MKKQYPQVFFQQKLKGVRFPLCLEQNSLKKLKYKKKKRRNTQFQYQINLNTEKNQKQNIYYKQIQDLSSNLSIKRAHNSSQFENKLKMPKIANCYRNFQNNESNEKQFQLRRSQYSSQHKNREPIKKHCTLGLIKKQKSPIFLDKFQTKSKRTLSNFKLLPIQPNVIYTKLKGSHFSTEYFQGQQKIISSKSKLPLQLRPNRQQQQIKPWQMLRKQISEEDQCINFDIF